MTKDDTMKNARAGGLAKKKKKKKQTKTKKKKKKKQKKRTLPTQKDQNSKLGPKSKSIIRGGLSHEERI